VGTNLAGVHRSTRSSRATWLAAAGGAAAVGVSALASGWPAPARVAGGAWAGFVLASGIAARVTGFTVGPRGLLVRRAILPDRLAGWSRVRRLTPPRTPLGAWRIATADETISLMPSDVLGAEALLAALVVGAGLSFDGRRWHRPQERV